MLSLLSLFPDHPTQALERDFVADGGEFGSVPDAVDETLCFLVRGNV